MLNCYQFENGTVRTLNCVAFFRLSRGALSSGRKHVEFDLPKWNVWKFLLFDCVTNSVDHVYTNTSKHEGDKCTSVSLDWLSPSKSSNLYITAIRTAYNIERPIVDAKSLIYYTMQFFRSNIIWLMLRWRICTKWTFSLVSLSLLVIWGIKSVRVVTGSNVPIMFFFCLTASCICTLICRIFYNR